MSKRPKITGFFGEEITLQQVHKTYLKQPSLYNYAQALDNYTDKLEDYLTQCERILNKNGIAPELMEDIQDTLQIH